jgi:hypothetical protein
MQENFIANFQSGLYNVRICLRADRACATIVSAPSLIKVGKAPATNRLAESPALLQRIIIAKGERRAAMGDISERI